MLSSRYYHRRAPRFRSEPPPCLIEAVFTYRRRRGFVFFPPRSSEKPRLAANRCRDLPRTATRPREIFGENRWLRAPGAVEEYRKRSSVIKYKTRESIVPDAIRQYCVQNARPPRAKNGP